MANHKAGYAIVTLKEILEEGILLPDTSSKKAEIITLTEALHLNESEIIIYSDSKYAFLVMHAMGNLEGGGLLISKSKKIKYVQENPEIARCDTKTKGSNNYALPRRSEICLTSKGNKRADQAAKEMAQTKTPLDML